MNSSQAHFYIHEIEVKMILVILTTTVRDYELTLILYNINPPITDQNIILYDVING